MQRISDGQELCYAQGILQRRRPYHLESLNGRVHLEDLKVEGNIIKINSRKYYVTTPPGL